MYGNKLSQVSLLLALTLCSFMAGAFLINPAGAADAGNYIVTEYSTEKLSMITPGGVRTEIYSFKMGTYDIYPYAVAIDKAGNYIVTAQDEDGYGRLYRITPSGVETLVYAWGGYLNGPAGVAVDGSGNYIVTEGNVGALRESSTLSKITPSGVRTVLYTFPISQYPNFVAIDGSGNYIVTDYVNDVLIKITPGGVRTVIYNFGGGSDVMGVAVDSSGNYIVVEQYAQKLSMITPGGVRTVIYNFAIPGQYADPCGVAIVPGAAAGYSVTIWGWDYIYGWQIPVPISKDGVPTGYSTPHSFAGLTGTHTFTVPSTDALGHKFYEWNTGWTGRTITVSSAGVYTARYKLVTTALTVTSPNGGEKWIRGTTHTLKWSSSGSPGANVKIELMKGGVLNKVIVSSTANDGSYSWTIPSTQTLGTDYRIRITSTSKPAITDSSNSNFAIVAGTLTVTSPNGGESWKRDTTHTITWSKAGSPGAYVKIELLKGGVVNKVITSSTANDGSYSWAIPSTQTAGTDYKIRITSTTYSSIKDSSNSNFAITA